MSITIIVPVRHGDPKPDKKLFPSNTLFIDDAGKGKKYALLKGVEAATTDYVWFRDADTTGATDLSAIGQLSADMYILPLRMTEGNGSLLCRLQATEYEAIQRLTIEAASKGRAVMCSGANLIVRRQAWLTSYEDIHPEIPSGDDMFILESFKRRRLSINTLCKPELTAIVEPQPTLRGLLRQRMRWAGKAPHYTDSDIRLCAAAVAIMNILCILCPLFYIPKYLVERRFISSTTPISMLLSIIYPYYMLISAIGGLIHKGRW